MFIKLPLDIWRDAFDFFSLEDRMRLAHKFDECFDHEFSDIGQKWLHEWIKNIRIEKLKIKAEENKAASLHAYKWDDAQNTRWRWVNKAVVPFAESELPANIQDFKEIHIKISHADPTVLQFLRRMQPLFRNICLQLYYINGQSVEEAVLVQLLPILIGGGGMETIHLETGRPLFTIRQHHPLQFFGTKHIWLLLYDDNTTGLARLLLRWLCTRRDDDEPRMLTLNTKADTITELFNGIQTQFHNATSPVSFVCFLVCGAMPSHKLITQNDETNEQLVCELKLETFGIFMFIGRCPSAVDGRKWIHEMIEKNNTTIRTGSRKITISPLIVSLNR